MYKTAGRKYKRIKYIYQASDLAVNFEVPSFRIFFGEDFAARRWCRKRYIIQRHHVTVEEFGSETRV